MGYVTPSDLASYLQKNLDTATAQLVIDKASALFSARANTQFAPTTYTYETIGTGSFQVVLPFRPIISIQAVRVGGVTITDYSRIKTVLYRIVGWGVPGIYPPQSVQVDLTHGYASAPDDVKAAVLETAGAAYQSPDNTIVSEEIDDYAVKFSQSGAFGLSENTRALADLYKGSILL